VLPFRDVASGDVIARLTHDNIFEICCAATLLCNTLAVSFVHDFPSRSMNTTGGGVISENCVFVKGGCRVCRFCFWAVGR
jgi:hypothetical protein